MVTVLIGFQWVSAFGHLGVRVKRVSGFEVKGFKA